MQTAGVQQAMERGVHWGRRSYAELLVGWGSGEVVEGSQSRGDSRIQRSASIWNGFGQRRHTAYISIFAVWTWQMLLHHIQFTVHLPATVLRVTTKLAYGRNGCPPLLTPFLPSLHLSSCPYPLPTALAFTLSKFHVFPSKYSKQWDI